MVLAPDVDARELPDTPPAPPLPVDAGVDPAADGAAEAELLGVLPERFGVWGGMTTGVPPAAGLGAPPLAAVFVDMGAGVEG